MNREDARKAAEVMLAYADGKEVGYINSQGEWQSYFDPVFNWGNKAEKYRIKPTPTYRPFASAEECWEEMKKHEPFGWVKSLKRTEAFKQHSSVISVGRNVECDIVMGDGDVYFFRDVVKNFTFADGTPFGKLTEEK